MFYDAYRVICNDLKIIELLRSKHTAVFKDLFDVVKPSNNKSKTGTEYGKSDNSSPAISTTTAKLIPKMTRINEALSFDDVRKLVWVALGFDENVQLPSFPSDLLYGRLSEMLHVPKFWSILTSDTEDEGYKSFFFMVVSHYKLTSEEYSEEEAAAGKAAMDEKGNK